MVPLGFNDTSMLAVEPNDLENLEKVFDRQKEWSPFSLRLRINITVFPYNEAHFRRRSKRPENGTKK